MSPWMYSFDFGWWMNAGFRSDRIWAYRSTS